MLRSWRARLLGVLAILAAGVLWIGAADPAPPDRDALMKAFKNGNFKDAYEGLRKLALDPKDEPKLVSQDLQTAVTCLQRLGRVDEIDDFREGVIESHKTNWRLLETAATTYAHVEHQGYIVAGKYYRGHKRGGGRYVNAWQRDRVRSLQLMQQAMEQTKNENDKTALAQFYIHFADMLMNEPWRLQYLSDLTQLPDYDEGYYYGGGQGAPVDADGNPVFHQLPKSYSEAKSDGERWRFMLLQAAELDARRVSEVDIKFANFQRSQFGVQTMAYYGRGFRPETGKENNTGTFALHTLSEEETIARLATGLKRFKIPDEFNWIKTYQKVAARGKSQWGQQARDTLGQLFEDRRQYVKAADAWREAIKDYGVGERSFRQQRLDQIVKNWGRFEPGQMQPAGANATVDFRFRNGSKVSFEAHAINVPKLLADVKAYLQANPGRLDWQHMNINNIGHRLVEQNQRQYLMEKVAAWDLALKPRPEHVDDRVTVRTPLSKPGAYLLVGKMADGNESRIVVWVADTVIVKKQLDNQVLYYVADAVTGQPVAKAEVEFFGYKQIQVAPGKNEYKVLTTSFKDVTDQDGQITLTQFRQPTDYQWLITARAPIGPAEGRMARFAYLGFTHVWFNRVYDPEYNATKVFLMTDRPVYRPSQKVEFKAWVRHAKYDQPDASDFANVPFTVRIHNPKGEKVFEKVLTADEYAGLAGDFPLEAGTTLGVWGIQVIDTRLPKERYLGGSSFRVEEYKKPEFEVKIEAPKEPVQLGEQVSASIEAKYYFGAPVTSARVKYKVLRTSYSANWYPRGDWDWFYGSGYWWFAPDANWYPGFGDWCGCRRPYPWWMGRRHEQPEVVLENEVPVGPDGRVVVQIDTRLAKELHGDTDHQYSITAEVTDESRRTIVGTGNVLVSRKPFTVYTWLDRGYYRAGDTITAFFNAQTLDKKPVEGKGELTLRKITYNEKREPIERVVQTWKVDTNVEGFARQQMKAAEPGQYRLSYKLTDSKQHAIEGGYLFVIRGAGPDAAASKDFRFNDIEIVTDKREYAPGEKVKLLINTNRADGVVLLFVRPTNGVYLAPKMIRLKGKSVEEEIGVVMRDMPNFFVEVLTIADGRVHTEIKEIVVPPEKRILNVEVQPSQTEYKPGQKATVKVKLTDLAGKPFVGSTVLTVYDKSVEYISGGTNVPEIKEFFWKWRRHHSPSTQTSLSHYLGNLLRSNEIGMGNLGIFGELVVEELSKGLRDEAGRQNKGEGRLENARAAAAPGFGADREQQADGLKRADAKGDGKPGDDPGAPPPAGVEPAVRKNFADTAFWTAALNTNKDGIGEVSFSMPENLTGWKIKVWGMGHGTKVGQGEAEVVTKKDLIVRLQAPRFFVEKDEVVLSANVHNYLKNAKDVAVSLELGGNVLASTDSLTQRVKIDAGGEKRVDWRVKVISEGLAIVRMKVITDEESDAMEMRFPAYIHGMLKMESFSGVVRPNKDSASVVMNVPAERRINESRLEVRYSPTLAGAMVDALPYMVDYPYGCTEQTLNRFLPTVITQNILKRMNLNLKDIEEKRTNLNAQEIGDAKERAKGWKRFPRNPVFNEAEVKAITAAGVQALAGMQCSDGGWGWFSGWGERSWPHTTAVVVHGLQIAKENGVALPQGMLERGIDWLKSYQAQQVQWIKNAPTKTRPWKDHADNIDAFVYMVLADGAVSNAEMREFLYRDRNYLAVYSKAMFGLALHKEQQADKLAMILKNIEQYVVQDDENQTAYLRLPADNFWWNWYGAEIEADAYYLKLLARTSPKSETASRLVKYLLNNRKHATYWTNTRDTAICIEAMAEYLVASGEDKPDMTIEVWLDGKKHKEVKVDASNLFTFDNTFVMFGDAVETGKHTVEIKRKGTGPVYFNAYLTNFTLEDFITRAGLEVKVNRKYYKLTRIDKEIKVSGARGQALDQKVEKYQRTELANLATLKSGDLVEVELEIDSKNDYEYLIFEDPKAAGFEPVAVRSGYNRNDLGAYMELRDAHVSFFVRAIARGKHSVSYRMRAEIPGKFSALPTRAYAMYAPELKGNSDEIKLAIVD